MTENRHPRLIILGAAGRDFHDFNVYWKNRPDVEVVCFTATQIPDIDGRTYPPELSGARYPDGIPTSVIITTDEGQTLDSGLVMYPAGHARNETADLAGILEHKFNLLGSIASDTPADLIARYRNLGAKSADDIKNINTFDLTLRDDFEDA